ncbi:hypothetical protein JW756_01455 [Candidatus Woesearchaeota archaeon]|nr:hypothetical protein [Candidatus Woesearchaeota archaeon]
MRKNNKTTVAKKAELQMTETIFVVFIIIIIIVLSVVFYSKFQEVSIKEKQRQLRNARVVEIAHRLSFWPELECSEIGTSEFMCLDITKLMVLGSFINQTKQDNSYSFNYYFDLLRNSKISVVEIYPSDSRTLGTDYWILWENAGKTKTADMVRVPVSLYNPLTKAYALGVMELQVYE